MIRCIEVKNYRSLKYIRQQLNNFQVLVGANASGKTTFLDTISFVSDIIQSGVDDAITKRTSNYPELTYLAYGGDIEIAIEIVLPVEIRNKLFDKDFNYIRYEIRIGLTEQSAEHAIIEEYAVLLKEDAEKIIDKEQLILEFPMQHDVPETILNRKYKAKYSRRLFSKKIGGNDNFYSETVEKLSGKWTPSFKFGYKKTALGNLPADATLFPASAWLKEFLTKGVQLFILDSLNIRKPSPPGQARRFKTDGSNLPWVIDELKKDMRRFNNWLDHIRTALPDIENIDIIERAEDKHKYIRICYYNGGKIPSWLVSDGTLRLFALTITAYLPNLYGVFLIEEPENGIHPKAMETVYQSLSSVYDAQILLASHSPVILSMVKPHDVLCFAKTEDGATDIVNGLDHPKLKNWKGSVNLSDLFAGGILG